MFIHTTSHAARRDLHPCDAVGTRRPQRERHQWLATKASRHRLQRNSRGRPELSSGSPWLAEMNSIALAEKHITYDGTRTVYILRLLEKRFFPSYEAKMSRATLRPASTRIEPDATTTASALTARALLNYTLPRHPLESQRLRWQY